MTDDPDLRVSRRLRDQPRQSRKQIRMQAGLRFVEHHQRRGAGCQQRADQQHVTQGSVRPFPTGEWAKHARLVQREIQLSVAGRLDLERRAWKRIVDRVGQCCPVTDLDDRLQRRGEIATIVMQDRRACRDSALACRGIAIATKAAVEAPAAQCSRAGRIPQARPADRRHD